MSFSYIFYPPPHFLSYTAFPSQELVLGMPDDMWTPERQRKENAAVDGRKDNMNKWVGADGVGQAGGSEANS